MEVERQLERSKLVQKNTFEAVLAGVLLQVAISVTPQLAGTKFAIPVGRALFGAAGILGLKIPMNLAKLRKLDKYNQRYGVK